MSETNTPDNFFESAPLEDADEKLYAFFQELEKDSLKTLEDAARQIVGLVTTLLGLFFGVLAFKDNPAFLALLEIKIAGALSAVGYIAALFLALDVTMPRPLALPAAILTDMRDILHGLYTRKSRSLKLAQYFFAGGTAFLFVMILRLLWG